MISVTFKVSGGTQFDMELDPDWTVKELKQKCEEKAAIPVVRQRVIYKGRILKDDDKVSVHDVQDGHMMHLVKSAAPAGTASETKPDGTVTPGTAVPTPNQASTSDAATTAAPAATGGAGVPASNPVAGQFPDNFMQLLLGANPGYPKQSEFLSNGVHFDIWHDYFFFNVPKFWYGLLCLDVFVLSAHRNGRRYGWSNGWSNGRRNGSTAGRWDWKCWRVGPSNVCAGCAESNDATDDARTGRQPRDDASADAEQPDDEPNDGP
eukprot:GHVT01082878.1.p2 GENE.GHVT01082878.1~~GHVT01082878.1.p2  ORF type:complete len:264 (+),score=19.67 GHVT01082878.1:3138-3929(+)